MDDDITFGASVWGTSDVVDTLSPLQTKRSSLSTSLEPHFIDDQFDDFESPLPAVHGDMADEDFGEFDEADVGNSTGFEDDESFGEEVQIAGPSSYVEWLPLGLNSLSSRSVLEDQVGSILEPIWGSEDISRLLTNDRIREVEGVTQILVTPESRDLHKALMQSPPPTKPPNWTRSRIRRQHLIALGIPVNLDEVLPRAIGKPLPPLQITTRPMSAPPGPRNSFNQNAPPTSYHNSRAATPVSRQPTPPSHFGPKPELDNVKIEKLLALDPEMLTIQPLSTLEKHLADLRAQTTSTSALLTHLLQIRESLQQDNETYNGLIAELVGEAQKIKSGKPRMTSNTRRGSGMN
ncbi:hypothetical protein BDZ94DRAFT_1191017 [Collybia nuda]|uniref:Uncharacterized protein n=1 Tax=Collybia nuda TaxID=64659 RepID=A0A9P5Y9L3_9AGAR|nr:hypothetical protein BDZ94DRAFT_1191017 [Collybia nuda]